MIARAVETALVAWADRHFPASVIQQRCRLLQASEAVDGVLFADQLANFIPAQLWNERNTPLAKVLPDPDSHGDAFIAAAYALAVAPDLDLHLSTDTVRRQPAELIQAMLTLAQITEGRAHFHLGAGENKQCAPFGHRRAQGLGRMGELFDIFDLLMTKDGPVDYHGKYFQFTKAWLGNARPHRPKIWGLGGGPKLVAHTVRHGDGLAAAAPLAWSSPEQLAEVIAAVRKDLVAQGRDPQAFRFGLYCAVLVHDDAREIERAIRNPLIRFMTGIFGRIHMPDWAKEGLALPAPAQWSYFKDLLPYDTDDAFIAQMLDAVSDAHVRRAWYAGSPTEVARQLQPFIDAGADWIVPLDYLSMITEPDDAQAAFQRSIDVCAAIKAANPNARRST